MTIVVVMAVFASGSTTSRSHDPDQFAQLQTRLDALYFTMATAATVGYGDVHAVGQTARALVLVQMVFNVVFIGTAVALLSARVREVVVGTGLRSARRSGTPSETWCRGRRGPAGPPGR